MCTGMLVGRFTKSAGVDWFPVLFHISGLLPCANQGSFEVTLQRTRARAQSCLRSYMYSSNHLAAGRGGSGHLVHDLLGAEQSAKPSQCFRSKFIYRQVHRKGACTCIQMTTVGFWQGGFGMDGRRNQDSRTNVFLLVSADIGAISSPAGTQIPQY